NIPLGPTAGAIVAGAFFGDKMSPLSDTTNLASGLTHTNIFKHIKHMLYTTVPAVIITLIVFQWYTVKYINNTSVDLNSIETIRKNISEAFVISQWLLFAQVIVLVVLLIILSTAL